MATNKKYVVIPGWITSKADGQPGKQRIFMTAPTIEAAHKMGERGGTPPDIEAERLAFEAWVRGHCWEVGAVWNGSGYIGTGETGSYVCPAAMQTRRMWAAWRDRAALSETRKEN